MQIYHAIYRLDQDGAAQSLFMTRETKQYVNMRFAQRSTDWHLDEGQEAASVHSYKYFAATNCSEINFMTEEPG